MCAIVSKGNQLGLSQPELSQPVSPESTVNGLWFGSDSTLNRLMCLQSLCEPAHSCIPRVLMNQQLNIPREVLMRFAQRISAVIGTKLDHFVGRISLKLCYSPSPKLALIINHQSFVIIDNNQNSTPSCKSKCGPYTFSEHSLPSSIYHTHTHTHLKICMKAMPSHMQWWMRT